MYREELLPEDRATFDELYRTRVTDYRPHTTLKHVYRSTYRL